MKMSFPFFTAPCGLGHFVSGHGLDQVTSQEIIGHVEQRIADSAAAFVARYPEHCEASIALLLREAVAERLIPAKVLYN